MARMYDSDAPFDDDLLREHGHAFLETNRELAAKGLIAPRYLRRLEARMRAIGLLGPPGRGLRNHYRITPGGR